MNIGEISDGKLLVLCEFWGRQALEARNKFATFLPEVQRRKLFQKKGFNSIFEFAFKLAGFSEEQVRLAINAEKRMEHTPATKAVFQSGKISLSKIKTVLSVLNSENDKDIAVKLVTLPRKALETYVRDVKSFPGEIHIQQQIEVVKTPHLSDEVKKKLNELQEKGIDINELILNALAKREAEIGAQKAHLAETTPQTESRYINVRTRRLIKKEFGTKCAIANCTKNAQEIHHTHRFSLAKNHNPYFLAPLCKAHHQIAHGVDATVVLSRMRHGP